MELTWVLTPFPQNTFGSEYKHRSSLCAHAIHRTDSKDPDVHVLDGVNAGNKNTPSIHHDGMKVPQWSDLRKKAVTYARYLTQNGESQRCSWGTEKKKSVIIS